MDKLTALDAIFQLIEQTNAAGAFKKLKDLDHIREAYQVIETIIKEPKKESEQT